VREFVGQQAAGDQQHGAGGCQQVGRQRLPGVGVRECAERQCGAQHGEDGDDRPTHPHVDAGDSAEVQLRRHGAHSFPQRAGRWPLATFCTGRFLWW
jgi:hypothetical protein